MRWICIKPNDCKEDCETEWPSKPTGCIFEDEEDIPKDADIWIERN